MSQRSSQNPANRGLEHHDDNESVARMIQYAPEDQISLLEIFSVLLEHRYSVLKWTFTVAALAVLHLLLMFSPTYTSEAAFMPQETRQSPISGLEAVAGRFGFNIPSVEGGRSPEFYANLLKSREILRPILRDTFTVHGDGGESTERGTILTLLEVDVPEEPLRIEQGVRWLKEAVSVSITQETGVVNVSVTTPWPELSLSIGRRLLQQVNHFNLQTRQSQAGAERRFVEERLREAAAELRAAEDELKRFLETNRQFQNSPELVFEHERLERRVAMRQQLFTELSQAYEETRIAEVKNTPVITILEPPELPARRDPRGLLRRGALGLLFGATLGLILAFVGEFTKRNPEEASEDYHRFRRVWSETANDIRRIVPGLKADQRQSDGENSS